MPEELGRLPKGIYPFERCNLWLPTTALSLDADRVRFVRLWNGGGGVGPGHMARMYSEVKRRTGRAKRFDTRSL
jgi:hypothetical protein